MESPEPGEIWLREVRVRAKAHGNVILRGQWAFRKKAVPEEGLFFYVEEGTCSLQLVDGSTRGRNCPLKAGDFVFMPKTVAYKMSNCPSAPVVDLDDTAAFFAARSMHGFSFEAGQGEATARLLNGKFLFDKTAPLSWSSFFPEVMILDARALEASHRLGSLVELLAREIPEKEAGSHLVIERLLNILLVYAVRHHLEHSASPTPGPLLALLDSRIGPVLHLLHENLREDWTLEELAKKSGLSRSIFAGRFRRLVGESPVQYLTRLRLLRASEMLRETDLTIPAIAEEAGYSDEFAFRKAFRRVMGVPPATFRDKNPLLINKVA